MSRYPSSMGEQTLLYKVVAVGPIVRLTAVCYLGGDYLQFPGLAQAEFEQAMVDAILL